MFNPKIKIAKNKYVDEYFNFSLSKRFITYGKIKNRLVIKNNKKVKVDKNALKKIKYFSFLLDDIFCKIDSFIPNTENWPRIIKVLLN